jgi:hypothetical protein
MLIIQIEDHTSAATLRAYKGMLDVLIFIKEDGANECKPSNEKQECYLVHPVDHVIPQIPQPPVTQDPYLAGMNVQIPQPPTKIDGPAASLAQLSQPLVAGVEVDSKGDVWDGRIHAATRAKVADGTWRMKRGIDDATVAAVRAEHAKTQAAPTVSPGMFERNALAALGAGTQTVYTQPAPAAAFGNPTVAPPPPPVSAAVSTGTIPNSAISPGEPARLTFPRIDAQNHGGVCRATDR